MSYRIFVSHTEIDTPIAEAVTKVLNDAFQGQIILYLAQSQIVGGGEWKKELQKNLQNSNAIVSIVTPESIKKPWLYIEWGPFWLAGKTFFTLLTNEIKATDLIQPMGDRQAIDMTAHEQVSLFFKGLSQESKLSIPIPFAHIPVFINKIKEAQLKKKDSIYRIFRDNLGTLPGSDDEKRKIAKYFYQIKELDTFKNIVNTIVDDSVKHDIIQYCLFDSGLVHDSKLRLTFELTKSLNGADRIANTAISLIKLGNLDSVELREMLEDLCNRNQAELRKVAIHLASEGHEDSQLFQFICDISTNLAELRKVAIYFVKNNRFDSLAYEKLMEKIDTVPQLRQIANEFLRNEYQNSPQFIKIMETISDRAGKTELENMMSQIKNHDPNMFSLLQEKFFKN